MPTGLGRVRLVAAAAVGMLIERRTTHGGLAMQSAPPNAATSVGRLFLGIALTEAARRGIRSQLQGEELPGRVIPVENWHLTLTYLGDTAAHALESLTRELSAADLGDQIAMELGGLGAFPRAARASVLWLGVRDGADEIAALNARVVATVGRVGLPVEDRPFVPHLTLCRIRPPRDVRRLLARAPAIGERVLVDAVVLFRSHRGLRQPRYEELERFPLASPARG